MTAIYYSPKTHAINLIRIDKNGLWRVYSSGNDYLVDYKYTLENMVDAEYELIGYL